MELYYLGWRHCRSCIVCLVASHASAAPRPTLSSIDLYRSMRERSNKAIEQIVIFFLFFVRSVEYVIDVRKLVEYKKSIYISLLANSCGMYF